MIGSGIGAVTGVGGAGGLAVYGTGGAIQLIGAGAKALSGDRTAVFDLAVGLVGGKVLKAVVPKQLQNDFADAISESAIGETTGFAAGDPCARR
ncbi:hypothetical protein [Qipengyuania sp.]|uniref:hypothetical protein n=1 Tax=Qipengyuania sp. TaxID=2004515 RepID=UPI003736FF5A